MTAALLCILQLWFTRQLTSQILSAHGADVKARDVHGETPLHFAALAEDIPVVKQLFLAGADALASATQGDIPFFLAYEADTRAVAYG